MKNYILRRLFFMVPTLFGLMLINFAVVQVAPGGPVERAIAAMTQGNSNTLLKNETGDGVKVSSATPSNNYQGRYVGVDDRVVAELEKFYGFDKPVVQRFFIMIKNYLQFNFGVSFSTGQPIMQMIAQKIPVSLSLGLWSALLIYAVSIPLGIKQATRKDSYFDKASTVTLIMLSSLPAFLLAVFLIIFFCWRALFFLVSFIGVGV